MANRVSIGMGIMHFPFSNAQTFWRWVDLCEQGGIDLLWQSDRLVSEQPYPNASLRWPQWPGVGTGSSNSG